MYKWQSMARGKMVITGGRGFVGEYLRREIEEHWPGQRVVLWDLPTVDITRPETYRADLERLQPEWLVHLAAVSSAMAAIKDPARTFQINVKASQNILAMIEELSPQTKVLAISTADIYGQGSATPLSELPLSAAKPVNPYAESKLAMEKMIEERFQKRVIRVRPFPHIGPGQRPGFVTADFASQLAAIEAGRQEPKIQVGNLTAKRDFTDVRDVARAYRLLMEKGKMGEVYHVASGKAVAIQEILDKLKQLSTAQIQVVQDPARLRPSDIPVLIGDATKLSALTGWTAQISLDQSLEDILNWWREQTR